MKYQLDRHRRDEVDRMKAALGGMVIRSAALRPGRLTFRRRGVVVVPPRTTVKFPPGTRFAVHEEVDRDVLCRVLSDVCAYPAALLDAPAADAIALLRMLDYVPMLVHYGALRNLAARRQAARAVLD